jgi:hypothetical protein
MKNHGQNRLPSVNGYVVNLTLNLCYVAIVYLILAALVAAFIRHFFDRFNDAWKNLDLSYQITDVLSELSLVVVSSFWVTYMIHFMIPVFNINSELEHFVEAYGGLMVFFYSVFLFVRDLNDKLVFIYDRIIGDGVHRSN